MSVRVMSDVWDIDLPASDKIVLLALADCANDDGHCWPGMVTLQRKCSKGDRTIQAAIKRLVEAGHLTRNEVPGKGCNYFVHPRKNCAPAKTAPPQKLTPTPAKSAGKPSRTITNLYSDEPVREQHWPEIPAWMPAEPWNGFLRMRKDKGKWPSDRAVSLMIGKLERWRAQGHDPGEILDTSTEGHWTGLWEPKEKTNGNHLPKRSSAGPDKRSGLARAIDAERERLQAFP